MKCSRISLRLSPNHWAIASFTNVQLVQGNPDVFPTPIDGALPNGSYPFGTKRHGK